MDLSVLHEYGIDYKSGIARCLNDASLYEKVLMLFLEDTSLAHARIAFDRGDYSMLFVCLHELKGAAGNADLTELTLAVTPLVELLRRGGGTDAEIARMYDRVEAAYTTTREGILQACGKAV